MKSGIKDITAWCTELEKVSVLRRQEHCRRYCELVECVTGKEKATVLHALMDSVKVAEDYDVYEVTYPVVWSFPSSMVGAYLAEILPSFQRRMKKADRHVARFYVPLPGDPTALAAFLERAAQWEKADKTTAIRAITQWAADDEEWEAILTALGKPLPEPIEDIIPEEWPEEWQKRMNQWRVTENRDEANYSFLWWGRSKEEWVADLDFLIAAISLNQGKRWREIKNWIKPLWYYAGSTAYQPFIEKVKELDEKPRKLVLEKIKKVNTSWYKEICKSLKEK